ncbi:snakin-2-like [Eucalyptus grandis]|uniref:snakin-2-like n=1 Tax=Eucalyptus grandis TaxID=71139 RepID=UPI00192ECE8E|nr:snakin-2-like [Eucalyptus grandis]
MAFGKSWIASLILLSLFLLHVVEAQEMMDKTGAPTPSLQPIDCGAACAARCKLSSRPNLCKRACGSCCAKCKCVPLGTAGNRETCPCYANLTTRDLIPKCP